MEDRRKRMLLASESCQGHATTEVLIGTLSNLPDQVIHHILSFLQIKDLTSFGCVSKRCREFYLSTPSLNFEGFSSKHLESYSRRLRLWSYLDRYLFNREFNRIQRFRIHWERYDEERCRNHWGYYDEEHEKSLIEDERFRLEKWICNAIRCNVEDLDINFGICYDEEAVRLPSSRYLKSLSVYGRIHKLKCLKLNNVGVVDEGLFKWISSSCKCIKELFLRFVRGRKPMDVTIESSSLESLYIEDVTTLRHLHIAGDKIRKVIIECLFWTDKDQYFSLCAPNLSSFNWIGSLVNRPDIGRLELLEEASICLSPSNAAFVYVSEILSCLSSVKVLTLNKATTMALIKGGSMPLLKNVTSLRIHIEGFLNTLVPTMASLLGGMSKLNVLIVKSDLVLRDPKDECCWFDMGYWKLQNIAFINQLKEITIELCCGSNGIEFATYILEHAQNLNKMTIVHSPQQSIAMSKLKKSKMTSNITLDFQEDQRRGPQK
ncbi:putative F-box/LRR-repeat protein At3g58880 [Argentina anserina]|uniref:putative F-box/LRR-repeat protein At3g58880 n=1 Tax=Argentina anserina TaxID=57926 RepID=UPI002176444B|nr:putative F-box/LRR-repeat protein At3g58880 [Potentilla anserina]